MSVIILILILSALIFVHELGHFLLAKKNGIRVDEFAIGFPPRLLSVKKGGTRYSLNLIPFGGYVKIFGENPDEKSLDPNAKDSFVNKSKLVQAAVLVAGVVFNIIFAWVLFMFVLLIGRVTTVELEDEIHKYDNPQVYILAEEGFPANDAGLMDNDIIKSIANGNEKIDSPMPSAIRDFISNSGENEVTVSVLRNGEIKDFKVTPIEYEDAYIIGIRMEIIAVEKPPFYLIPYRAGEIVVDGITAVFVGLYGLFESMFTNSDSYKNVSGPVGIVGIIGDAAQFGWINIISLTAMISLNLAVLNILPIPALDGGRLMFLGIEVITRRNIKTKVANFLNASFFLLLIILMIVITYADILKIFRN